MKFLSKYYDRAVIFLKWYFASVPVKEFTQDGHKPTYDRYVKYHKAQKEE